jgi:glycosyltransferase involved in cell wall biosynthesis
VTPTVSVIIPTFRRPIPLERAIRSALDQTGVSVEVIVLDDDPAYSGAAAAAAFTDERLRYVRCAQPSGGVPALVRNAGLAMARGEFTYFLDDDDELEPGALAAMSDALHRHPKAGVAVGGIQAVGRNAAVLEHESQYFARGAKLLRSLRHRHLLVATMLFRSTPFVNSAGMVRRSVALAIGGYAVDIPRCEDVEFYLRAIRESGFVFVDRPVVRYSTGETSLMHTQTDAALLNQSYETIHARYRDRYGLAEFGLLRGVVSVVGILGAALQLLPF